MKVKGVNRPQYTKKHPSCYQWRNLRRHTDIRANTGSFSASRSNICRPLCHPGGGRRLRTRKLAIVRHPNTRNPTARTAHGNPTESKSRFSIMGKQTPPSDDPDTTSPMANPRFLRNQVFVDNMAVWKLILEKVRDVGTLMKDRVLLQGSERGRIDSIHGKVRSSLSQKLLEVFPQWGATAVRKYRTVAPQ